MKLLQNIEKNISNMPKWQIVLVATLLILSAAMLFYIHTEKSMVTATVFVTDAAGITHEVDSTTMWPFTVSVGGIKNPEFVVVKWNINVPTDNPPNAVVKFKSTLASSVPTWPLWYMNTEPGLASYNDVNGYWTQTVQTGVNSELFIGGVPNWYFALTYPSGVYSGAEQLETLLAGQPDGVSTWDWRLYGYVEADGTQIPFDETAQIKVTKSGGSVSSLSVVASS